MAETVKLNVVTLEGLTQYDGLLKSYIDAADAAVDKKSLKTVALVGNKLNFYNVVEPVGSTAPVYSIELPETDISNLMEKLPSNVEAETLVVADGKGGVKSAEVKISEIAKKTEVTEAVAGVTAKVDANTDKLTKLIGDDANKSARTIANEELAKQLIPENAQESLDTLTEIAAWIQSHPDDASAMNTAIEELEVLVGEIPEDVTASTITGYVAEVKAALEASINSAKDEAVASAATDATTKANKALEDAKTYTNTEVGKDRARLDAAETAIQGLDTTTKKNASDIEGVQSEVTTIKSNASALKDRVDAAEKDIDALEEKVATLEANGYDDTEVRDLIATNTQGIADLKKKDTELEGKISANGSKIDAATERVATAEGNITTLQSEMDAVEKKAADNASAITKANTTISAHEDRLTALEANPVVEAITSEQIAALFNN